MIGISPDSLKKHEKFKSKHGLAMPLVADEERKAIEAYGVWGEKRMFGRKYMGVDPLDLPDRPRRQDRPHLAQRKGFRPRRGGAGIGEGALTRFPDVEQISARGVSVPKSTWENNMLRGVLLWMLGIPIPIIILLWLFLD